MTYVERPTESVLQSSHFSELKLEKCRKGAQLQRSSYTCPGTLFRNQLNQIGIAFQKNWNNLNELI